MTEDGFTPWVDSRLVEFLDRLDGFVVDVMAQYGPERKIWMSVRGEQGSIAT